MSNKKEIKENQMFWSIVGRFICLIIAFYLLANFVNDFLELTVQSELIKTIAIWIFQFLIIFLTTSYSIKLNFKNCTIVPSAKKGLIKKLIIFILVICVFNFAYGIFSVESRIKSMLNSNDDYQMIYQELKENTTEESFKKYEDMLNNELDKIRIKSYKNVLMSQSIKSIMYITMIPVIKNLITKEVMDEETTIQK